MNNIGYYTAFRCFLVTALTKPHLHGAKQVPPNRWIVSTFATHCILNTSTLRNVKHNASVHDKGSTAYY